MRKIIIDCDPGSDDAFALALAIKSNVFDIRGITIVEGNVSLEDCARNTFKILNLCGKDDIPVYKGLKSESNSSVDAMNVHGNNGLGGVEYEKIRRRVKSMSAIDYLIEEVNSNPKEITVIALGALTNIAAAIKKDKLFAKNVQELVIMGGSSKEGNITPVAEFNFYKDPVAADIVLKTKFESILVFGWNVTTTMPLLKKYEKKLYSSDKELPRFLYDITRSTAKHDKNAGYPAAIISDPITIAYLIDSRVARLRHANIKIDLTEENYGKSEVTYVDESNCRFAYMVDEERFYQILLENISK